MNHSYIKNSLQESFQALQQFMNNESNLTQMGLAIEAMVTTLKGDGRILSCGNGGSMCDSMHFVEELTGRYRKDRAPLAAMSMGDASHITCVANDYGFEFIFSRHVEAWGRKGDVLMAISTSGNSKNVILAVEAAKKRGMTVVGLLGKTGGALKEMVDIPIIVDHKITDRIQEVHIKIIHIMIEGIERALFPEHY
ncbi:MAG: D-sedoheptulose 7-phosphate isomerase [Bacteriovoracaceae bacterium]